MNARERILAIVVVAVVVVAGLGVVFYQFFLSPYRAKENQLAQLKKEGETKEARIAEIAAQRPRLERYRQESLPADLDLARKEYQRFLEDLARKSNFGQVSIADRKAGGRGVPTLPNKTPIYTTLGFSVNGRATLDSLVKMMEGFYRTGLLHQIKTLSIARPRTGPQQGQRRDELDVTLTVDALVVHGADKRATLMPMVDKRLTAADAFAAMRGGPTGLGAALWAAGPFGPHGPGVLADPERDYSALAAKNIFFGPPVRQTAQQNQTEVETLRFTTLNEITVDYGKAGRRTAMLYDVSSNDKMRLRTLGGFNTFSLVRNNQGATLVHGEVLKIDDRSLIFRVGLNASDPEDKAPYYPDKEKIYHLQDKDLEALVRDGLARTDDASRVFWVDKGRWDYLIADKMVSVNGRAFAFRWDLVKGFVLRDDGNSVILRVDDKFCAYRYDQNGRSLPPHEGYCSLRIGGSVADALRNPLKDGEIKNLAVKAP